MARNTSSSSQRVSIPVTIGVLLFAVFAGSNVQASEWNIDAAIRAGLNYTSNLFLDPEGGEDSEFSTTIEPSILITRTTKNFDFRFDYRLQGLLYANNDGLNEAYNFLDATLTSVLVPDWFYFDANANLSLTVIDPRLGYSHSSISVNGNSSEVATASVSPYLKHRIGAFTTFTAGLRGALVEYEEPQLFDSTQTTHFASLANERGAGILDWSFGYNSTKVDYDFGRSIELAKITGELALQFWPRTELLLTGGDDQNDIAGLTGGRVAEGTFWNVGLRGSLNDATTYEVRVGEQFFGDSYSAQFSRTAPNLKTTLSYTEDATTIGVQQLDYRTAISILGDIGGDDLPSINPELYIRKRLNLATTISLAKSSWRFSTFYEDRDFIRTLGVQGEGRENVFGGGLEWTWEYDDITDFTAAARATKFNTRNTDQEPEDYRLAATLRRQYFQSSYGTISVRRNWRSASSFIDSYTELAVMLGFGHNFQ